MNTQEFTAVYNESRNGSNHFVRHWANRRFQFSDGVESCAGLGIHWFIDICATELPKLLPLGDLGIVHLLATDGVANLMLELSDDEPPVWSRLGVSTDCPDGDWVFYLVNEGERFAMIIPSEY